MDLPSTHQPWTGFRDESLSQQGSNLGPEASPTHNSKVHRRKRSPALTERNDPQEAMSQILDSQMLPTKPPRRRRLTEGERRRVAHVRRMKACPSCRRKHQKVQIYALYIYTIESLTAENSAITYRMPIPTRTHSPLKALDRTHHLQIRGHSRSHSRAPALHMVSDHDLHPVRTI